MTIDNYFCERLTPGTVKLLTHAMVVRGGTSDLNRYAEGEAAGSTKQEIDIHALENLRLR